MSGTWIEPGKQFVALFDDFERSAWRWECQGEYHEPNEIEPWQQWRDGKQDDSWLAGWAEKIRRIRKDGKTFQRVRMLTDPLTDYLRWMLAFTHVNVEAGEDIRWLSQGQAALLGMPNYDFYLFDDARVAILHFNDNGVAGADLIDDAGIVRQHQQWRDLVWPHAVAHNEYLARKDASDA